MDNQILFLMEVIILENRVVFEKMEWDISRLLLAGGKNSTTLNAPVSLTYLAYVLKKSTREISSFNNMNDAIMLIEDAEVRNFVFENTEEGDMELLSKLCEYTAEQLECYILNVEERDYKMVESSTPSGIAKLAAKILDIQPGDKVLDNCSGTAGFLISSANECPDADYYGVEINYSTACIAKIRASIVGHKISITQGNALIDNFDGMLFDKGFSNYPFKMQIRFLNDGSDVLERVTSVCPDMPKGTSSDWIFNYRLVESIKNTGKAIAIMSAGGLWNTLDKPIREFFIKQGRIEAIIALPANLFAFSGVSVAMVVFGQNSGSIKFVDATNICAVGRRQNILTDENIITILDALHSETDISKSVSIEEIAKQNFTFSPAQYLTVKNEIKNGVPFESVILSITRGAPCTASELDDMVSVIPTDYQYLMLANIKKGMIDKELPYLKEISPKYEKYCVRTGNLLLSKNGYPFKVAVAEVPEGRKLLANGNVYIIQLDETKINPYYLKAFLESDLGVAELRSIVVGATIPNIGVAQLNKILIPLIPMEEQERVAARYQAVLDEIDLLRRKIEKAENSLKDIFPEDI